MRHQVVHISDRRDGGPVTLPGLLDHPLANLFTKVVDVVLGHQHLDAVHELLGRTRVFREDYRLLHEVDFYAQLVDRHPVLDVAVEAIRFLNQQGSAPRAFLAQRKATISLKDVRPVRFAVSTSSNS